MATRLEVGRTGFRRLHGRHCDRPTLAGTAWLPKKTSPIIGSGRSRLFDQRLCSSPTS